MDIMKIQILKPIESQNPLYPEASESLFEEVLNEHGGTTLAEIKEDGYRMQIHKKDGVIKTFTKSQNPFIMDLYPEIVASLKPLPNCILDAELIGEGKVGRAGFDLVRKRFRAKINEKNIDSYLTSGLVSDAPLALRVFDTLYWEQTPLIDKPLTFRRSYTEKIQEKKIIPSTQRVISNPEELRKWFETLTNSNYEGLVCKKPLSVYTPGAENSDWMKIKRSETIDAVILGVYMKDSTISQILCGVYNPIKNRYETLAKINSKRQGMNKELETLLSGSFVSDVPQDVFLNPKMKEDKLPDYFIQPRNSAVVEIAAMNIYYGKNDYSADYNEGKAYSLRIGWLKTIRSDKAITQASKVELLRKLYQKEKA
jgi:ATP-dependent DNA ligase